MFYLPWTELSADLGIIEAHPSNEVNILIDYLLPSQLQVAPIFGTRHFLVKSPTSFQSEDMSIFACSFRRSLESKKKKLHVSTSSTFNLGIFKWNARDRGVMS